MTIIDEIRSIVVQDYQRYPNQIKIWKREASNLLRGQELKAQEYYWKYLATLTIGVKHKLPY